MPVAVLSVYSMSIPCELVAVAIMCSIAILFSNPRNLDLVLCPLDTLTLDLLRYLAQANRLYFFILKLNLLYCKLVKTKMKNVDLSKIKRAHFVGMGGLGVSAIARRMLAEGKIVSGSDVSDSAIIDELRKLGAKIFLEHNADDVAEDVDLLVYTPALTADNPELKKAVELGIPTLSYPEMLGLISKNKYTIAVSGAYGKTTTTWIITAIWKISKKRSASSQQNYRRKSIWFVIKTMKI